MDKRRILIVDDNDELRAALEEVLRELGHDVVATGDREEAKTRLLSATATFERLGAVREGARASELLAELS